MVDTSTQPAGTPTPFKTVISNENIPTDGLPGTGAGPGAVAGGRELAVALGLLAIAGGILVGAVVRWRVR